MYMAITEAKHDRDIFVDFLILVVAMWRYTWYLISQDYKKKRTKQIENKSTYRSTIADVLQVLAIQVQLIEE